MVKVRWLPARWRTTPGAGCSAGSSWKVLDWLALRSGRTKAAWLLGRGWKGMWVSPSRRRMGDLMLGGSWKRMTVLARSCLPAETVSSAARVGMERIVIRSDVVAKGLMADCGRKHFDLATRPCGKSSASLPSHRNHGRAAHATLRRIREPVGHGGLCELVE